MNPLRIIGNFAIGFGIGEAGFAVYAGEPASILTLLICLVVGFFALNFALWLDD